ncbi:unnamed protein product [Acanthoscelides obtectus]|uniref:Uncharacterized protein n=1 Tax=Acanthoscelides obtectus TaxID=200917 RepID=A0A9P0P7D4_ACAOB|nr:unnamed protein product [Acanthoscelides obtectus]CAK1664262.1 hypothetical protein AOBTE_LOCUS24159 [Acanthoscelides obtectus]
MPSPSHSKCRHRREPPPCNMHQATQHIPLPITTRCIGFSTAQFFGKLYNLQNDAIPHHDIYAFYRASLAIFEAKMYFVKQQYEHLRRYDPVYNFKTYLGFVYHWQTFLPIAKFVESLGVMEYEGSTFCPIFTTNVYDDDEKLVPQSEHVTLTNLRETVSGLADRNTLQLYRKQFYKNCPLPGAIWAGSPEDPILKNPDDFIKPNYSDRDLEGDLKAAVETVKTAKQLLPKIVSCTNLLDKQGRPSMFVSNPQFNMRILSRRGTQTLQEYYRHVDVVGDIDDFWNVRSITTSEQMFGCLTLPGELPELHKHAYPYYSIRHLFVAPQRISISYKKVCKSFKV